MKKLFLIASLALLMALAAVTPALASSADDNCRHMLVNKQHLLDSDYVPSSLTPLSNYMAAGGNVTMTAEAAAAIEMCIRDRTSGMAKSKLGSFQEAFSPLIR